MVKPSGCSTSSPAATRPASSIVVGVERDPVALDEEAASDQLAHHRSVDIVGGAAA